METERFSKDAQDIATIMHADSQRQRLKAYYIEHKRIAVLRDTVERQAREQWLHSFIRSGLRFSPLQLRLPPFPVFPDDLRGLGCGAKTRTGTRCKITTLYPNGRCKLHGGLSTGPRTPEGKQRVAMNGTTPKRKQTP